MRAMRLFEQGNVEDRRLNMVELPVLVPGPGQISLRVQACGVCHTDLHTVEGDIHPPRMPVTPGHQVVGIVEAVGAGLGESFEVGDRVGVPWLFSACRSCEYCTSGQENLCPNARFTGFHVDGGYAESMLAEAAYALPLPVGVTAQQAAPLLCAGIVGYRSLRLSDVQPGETLGLIGFGASAHLVIQVALHWGCTVYVFTRSYEHRRHALELGAAWAGGIEDQAPRMLDRAVLFAPAGYLVPLILEKLRPGGTLAINAIHTSPIPEMPYHLIYGERTLRSVANATYKDGVDFLQLAAEIPVRSTVTAYSLSEANRALSDMKHSRINGEAVLIIS